MAICEDVTIVGATFLLSMYPITLYISIYLLIRKRASSQKSQSHKSNEINSLVLTIL